MKWGIINLDTVKSKLCCPSYLILGRLLLITVWRNGELHI